MEKVCESKRYNRHYNSIHTKHSNLGWINISILIFNKSGQEKGTDDLQFDDSTYHLTKEKSLTDRANAVLEHKYKILVEDLNKLDVERTNISVEEIKKDIEIPSEQINKMKKQNDVQKQ